MINIFLIILILIIIFLLFNSLLINQIQTKYIKSPLSNNHYLVDTSNNMGPKSAAILDRLHYNAKNLIDNLNLNTPNRNELMNLKNKFNQIELRENIELNKINNKNTSYTLDKKYIYLCLKNPRNSYEYYNDDVLMYVLIHELTHVADNQYILTNTHSPHFKQLMKEILDNANRLYGYDPNNINTYYCGIQINKY